MKKTFLRATIILLFIFFSANTILANNEKDSFIYKDANVQTIDDNSKQHFNLSQLSSITYDKNGNIVDNETSTYAVSINNSSIKPGQTKYYFPSSQPNGFYIIKGSIAEVNISLSSTSSVKIGLTNGSEHLYYGKTLTSFLQVYSTGYHKLYITNLGNETITVNGTIEY